MIWPEARKYQQSKDLSGTTRRFFPIASGMNIAQIIPWLQTSETDFRFIVSKTLRE